MKRGEIWWASLPEPRGSEPGYRRPVLIITDKRVQSQCHSHRHRCRGHFQQISGRRSGKRGAIDTRHRPECDLGRQRVPDRHTRQELPDGKGRSGAAVGNAPNRRRSTTGPRALTSKGQTTGHGSGSTFTPRRLHQPCQQRRSRGAYPVKAQQMISFSPSFPRNPCPRKRVAGIHFGQRIPKLDLT